MERLGGVHHVEDQAQLGQEVSHRLGDARALCQRRDGLVEVHVGRADLDPPVARRGRLALLDGLADRDEQLGPLAGGGARPPALGRATDRPALEDAAQLVEVSYVVHGQLAHEDAAVELVEQQALVAEQAERLAQGVARDPERRSDVLLGQPGARGEVALGDPVAEHVGDPARSAGAAEHGTLGLEVLEPVAGRHGTQAI